MYFYDPFIIFICTELFAENIYTYINIYIQLFIYQYYLNTLSIIYYYKS